MNDNEELERLASDVTVPGTAVPGVVAALNCCERGWRVEAWVEVQTGGEGGGNQVQYEREHFCRRAAPNLLSGLRSS